jgi:hypothetical protein
MTWRRWTTTHHELAAVQRGRSIVVDETGVRSVVADHVSFVSCGIVNRHYRDALRCCFWRWCVGQTGLSSPCFALLRRGTTGPSCTAGGKKPARRRPVITHRVRSGQISRWRSDPMRPLSTYFLLWWPPGRAYLVEIPRKTGRGGGGGGVCFAFGIFDFDFDSVGLSSRARSLHS